MPPTNSLRQRASAQRRRPLRRFAALACVIPFASALISCGGAHSAADAGAAAGRDIDQLLSAPHDWGHLSGALWDGSGLDIVALDRRIRPKTTGKWYYNPPINLVGPRLDLTGDFAVTAAIDVTAHPARSAFVDLYGSLPITYDEWRIDGRNVRFGVTGGQVRVWVNMVQQPFKGAAAASRVLLGLARTGSTLTFSVDGRPIGQVQDAGANAVFSSGKLYFGFDAELGGGFRVLQIETQGAHVADNGAELLRAHDQVTDSLRALAQRLGRPARMGTAAHASALLADPQYGRVLAQQYSLLTPEMDFKFQAIHPQPSLYAFAEAGALVEFAEKNGMTVHGHTLVWHEALPEWVWQLYWSGDTVALRRALLDHIAAVVGRYKGRVREWDTLNEIFSSDSSQSTQPYGLRSGAEADNNLSVWYQALGLQIYVEALRKVKEVDPAAENWINEFGIDQASSADKLDHLIAFVQYVNTLGQGQLVDGIGFQAHNYDPASDPARAEDLRAAMLKVRAQTGVKVRVSELDVEGASRRPTLFADKLAVCVELGCASFGTWGFTDRYGSMSSPVNNAGTTNLDTPNWGAEWADSLPFDAAYTPRSAWEAMRNVLRDAAKTALP